MHGESLAAEISLSGYSTALARFAKALRPKFRFLGGNENPGVWHRLCFWGEIFVFKFVNWVWSII